VEVFGHYAPRLLRARVARLGSQPLAPMLEQGTVALMLADISGFTPLTETLAESGRAGAERLSAILNGYFTGLIAVVERHGGDVIKFAGDALLALWTPGADDADETRAAWRAAQCALEVARELRGYRVDTFTLGLRVAIGAGPAHIAHVGGVYGRWEFVIAGSPLLQVALALQGTVSGVVVLSPEVGALLGARTRGKPRDGGGLELTALEPLPLEAAPREPELGPDCEAALRAYLPGALVQRLRAGETYVAELRSVTILFVLLPDLGAETSIDRAQQLMASLQRAVYAPFQGSINKLSVDDKGVSVLAALGLPPFSHEDDPARGALAALAVQRALRELGERCAIGVATGRVYCGEIGSPQRREYTLMGDSVNLAARLMQAATDAILCDETTVQRSLEAVAYAPPEELRVKGKARPVTAYRPLGARRRVAAQAESAGLIGRREESARLARALEELRADGRSRAIVIEGEAGIGKSRVLADVLERARASSTRFYLGAGDAIEQSTSYHAFKTVFASCLELDDALDPGERRQRALARFSVLPRGAERAPLLGSMLGIDLPETELTAQMSGEVRADNTQELAVAMLSEAAGGSPLLLAIDDAHWLDSASWSLLLKLRAQLAPLLLVVLLRPWSDDEHGTAEYARLLELPDTERFLLDRMSPEESVALVARKLGVAELPEGAARLIRERAEGHPFFSEELGYAMRDAGVLRVTAGTCTLAPGIDLAHLDLPDTVEGIITSRIDRLPPERQLTLKVASAIGRVFALDVLEDVHPEQLRRTNLPSDVDALAGLDLTPLEAREPVPSYIFKHVITQQVAYGLMLFAQRAQLHGRIARWYEESSSGERAQLYPLLAHHWSEANVADKALSYLELSAEQALRVHANAETIEFLQRALKREQDGSAGATSAERRAHWHAMLGEAEVGMGRMREAREHLERAVAELGFPAPATHVALAGALLREIAIQLWCRISSAHPSLEAADTKRRLDAAACYERLFLSYFFAGDAVRALLGTLRATNLAERTGEISPVLARCFASLGVALGAIPLHRPARFYLRSAIEAGASVGLPERSWIRLGAATYAAGIGEWDECEMHSAAGMELAEALGDRRRWEELAANLYLIRFIYGRFDASEDAMYRRVLESGVRREVIQAQGWGLSEWTLTLHALGHYAEMDTPLRRTAQLLERYEKEVDEVARLEGISMLAHQALRNDDRSGARSWIERGMALVGMLGRPSQYRQLPCTGYLAEAVLELRRRSDDPIDTALCGQAWRKLARFLGSYARIFPIGEPRLLWLKGRHHEIDGHRSRALRAYRTGVQSARRLAMPYDEARLLAALAALLPAAEAEAPQAAARALLARLGVRGEPTSSAS
jgi:class 3 adenylate cyclase